MPLDGILDHLQRLFNCIALRRTAGQRRTINPEATAIRVGMHDDIIRLAFHGYLISSVLIQFLDLAYKLLIQFAIIKTPLTADLYIATISKPNISFHPVLSRQN